MDTDVIFDTVATFCQKNNAGQVLTFEESNYIVQISDIIADAEDKVWRDGTSIAIRCDYLLESRDHFEVLLEEKSKYGVKETELQALAKMNKEQRDEMLTRLMEAKRIPIAERSSFRVSALFRIAVAVTTAFFYDYGYISFFMAAVSNVGGALFGQWLFDD